MDRLPIELLALICEHCDHVTQKSARLVDKRWEAASTSFVFEHFYMGLFGASLSKLRDLARSPLSKHVKKFTVFSDVLPDWPQHSWAKAIDFRVPFSEWIRGRGRQQRVRANASAQSDLDMYESQPRHSFSDEELENGYAAYRSCMRDQTNWQRNSLSIVFKEYFSMLPNIVEATVQCATPFAGRTNHWAVWKSLRKQILVGPDDWIWATDYQEAMYASLSGQAALSLLEGVAYRASFFGTKQIPSLRIHSPHLDPYRKLQLMDTAFGVIPEHEFSSVGVHHLLDGFRHLTKLRMYAPHATLSARLNGEAMAKETMAFLRTADQLQSLDLTYCDDELSPDDDTMQLETLFSYGSKNVLWPNIRRLALATNIPGGILIDFLKNHSNTLRSLQLKDMLIREVDYAIEQIPKVVKLDDVYLEQLWDGVPDDEDNVSSSVNHLCVLLRGTDYDDPYERAIKSYLLRQSLKLPKIERDGGFAEASESEGVGNQT